jgi:hypothetical protein
MHFICPAVNSKAQINRRHIFIEEIFKFFHITDDDHGPDESIVPVTIADKGHLTGAQHQQINLSTIKPKLGSGLKCLSYIGMIEPGYYNLIDDELGEKRTNVTNWQWLVGKVENCCGKINNEALRNIARKMDGIIVGYKFDLLIRNCGANCAANQK